MREGDGVMRERSIETRKGIRLQVREAGSGPALVYFHGVVGLLSEEPLLELLAQDFEVHAPN